MDHVNGILLHIVRVFPKKTPVLKVQNIANLRSDDKEVKIMKNIDI